MTKTVSPFFPKRNLIPICLLGAVAWLNSRRRAAEPVPSLTSTRKVKPMTTVLASTCVRSFLRVVDPPAVRPHHSFSTPGLDRVRLMLGLLAGIVVLAGLGSTALGQPQPALNALARQNAGQQIQALMADKDNRTKAQQKLDSQLIYAARESATGLLLPATPRLHHGLKSETDGRINVNIRGTVSADLLAAIRGA